MTSVLPREIADFLSIPLTGTQQEVVHHPPDGRHLLIEAPPGSGKTLTISRRIAHLVDVCGVQTEAIVALTFTERAAQELIDRISSMVPPGVYAGTFHSLCRRLLREESTGQRALARTLWTESQQIAAMTDAAREAGLVHIGPKQVGNLIRALSRVKCSQVPVCDVTDISGFNETITATIFDLYRQAMHESGACDFDDLILDTSSLLWSDREAAERFHNRVTYVFIDEFQDVSLEQYTLIRALLPSEKDGRQLTVVADQNQAIFGFRGAMPEMMLANLRRDYRPLERQLRENHRSVESIVSAARLIIATRGWSEYSRAVKPTGDPPDWFEFPTDEREARGVASLVQLALNKGRSLSDIAVLYRRHKRADLIEAALNENNIPVYRVEPGRFYDKPDVQETIRFFELVASTRDQSFASAVNWPRFLVDELTMIELRRIARAQGLTLIQVAESAGILARETSPLVARQITTFMQDVVFPARSNVDGDAAQQVDQMLKLLANRRPPVPMELRADMRSTLDEVGKDLKEAAEVLDSALVAGAAIAIHSDGHPDCNLAQYILQRSLTCYFNASLCDPCDEPEGAVRIALGEVSKSAEIRLTFDSANRYSFSVATQAWRLCQMVLMRREQRHLNRFVVFDMETGSNQVQTAEILDIGAVLVESGKVTGCEFGSLVRPSGPKAITTGSTNIHGLTWESVRNAPSPEEVLAQFVQFANDAILVGHNLQMFDGPILQRSLERAGLPRMENLTLDTLQIARRLRPAQQNRLDDLLTPDERRSRGTHRALDDARLTANVLLRLLDDVARDRELDVLSEELPAVGLSIFHRGLDDGPDNALLTRIAARAKRLSSQRIHADEVARKWLQLQGGISEQEDQRWDALVDGWQRAIEGFARIHPNLTLAELFERVELATMSDLHLPDRERLSMMTVYSAKGKEWPVVFLVGVEEGEFPYSWGDQAIEVAEGRRALYVGMTRAIDRLIVTNARSAMGVERTASPFLLEIADKFVKHDC